MKQQNPFSKVSPSPSLSNVFAKRKEISAVNETEHLEGFAFQFSLGSENKEAPKKSSKKKKKKKKSKNKSQSQDSNANEEDSVMSDDGDAGEGEEDLPSEIEIVPPATKVTSKEDNRKAGEVISSDQQYQSACVISTIKADEDDVVDDDGDEGVDDEDDANPNEPNATKAKKKRKPKKKKKKVTNEVDVITGDLGKLGLQSSPVYWKKLEPAKEIVAADKKHECNSVSVSQSQKQPQQRVAEKSSIQKTASTIKSAAAKAGGIAFISAKDSEIDEATKLKRKFGNGKNLVAIGPPKRKGTAWVPPPPGFSSIAPAVVSGSVPTPKPQSTKTVVAAESPAPLHSSPFSFGFGFK